MQEGIQLTGQKGWTEEEDKLFIRMHPLIGNKWRELSQVMLKKTENQVKNFYFSNLRKVSKQIVHFQKQFRSLLVPQSSNQSKLRFKSSLLNTNNSKIDVDKKEEMTQIMQNVPLFHVFCSQRAIYFLKVIYRIIDRENAHHLDSLDENFNKSVPKFSQASVEQHKVNETSVISLLRGNCITPKDLFRLIKTAMKMMHNEGLQEWQHQKHDYNDPQEKSEERIIQTNQINKQSVYSNNDDVGLQEIAAFGNKEHSIEMMIMQQSSELGTARCLRNKDLFEQNGIIIEKHHLLEINQKIDHHSDDHNQSINKTNHQTLIKMKESCIETFETLDKNNNSRSPNRSQLSFQKANINHQQKDVSGEAAKIQNQQHHFDQIQADDEIFEFGATDRYYVAEVPASTQFVDQKLEQLLQELDQQSI